MFYSAPSTLTTSMNLFGLPSLPITQQQQTLPTTNVAAVPAPMQWLQALNPYQQALILPLLQQMAPLSTPQMHQQISIDEQLMNSQNLFASALTNQSRQNSPNYLGETFQADSLTTYENSPNLAFFNLGIRGSNDCFSLQDSFAKNQNNNSMLSLLKPSIHHPLNSSKPVVLEEAKKSKKGSAAAASSAKASAGSAAAKKSEANANAMLGFDDKDDKNIIHINFTKNLLKSFRRYCEYFHKQNHAMLEGIKSDFESNHMNNQLLVHFMTSSLTMDAFKQFVNGPAQKWVKEQSRLKKQDQQLELIEICRQRLFDKIKVKKYSDSMNPASIDENLTSQQVESLPESQCTGQASIQACSAAAAENRKTILITKKRPILSALQSHKASATAATVADGKASEEQSNSDSLSSSSSSSASSSDSFDQQKKEKSLMKEALSGSIPTKKVCRREELVVQLEETDTKIEEYEQTIKIEDSDNDNQEEEEEN